MPLLAVDAIAISSPFPKRSCAAHLYCRLTISIAGSINLTKSTSPPPDGTTDPMATRIFSMLELKLGPVGMGKGLGALRSCAAVRAHRTPGVIEIVAHSTLSSEVKV